MADSDIKVSIKCRIWFKSLALFAAFCHGLIYGDEKRARNFGLLFVVVWMKVGDDPWTWRLIR